MEYKSILWHNEHSYIFYYINLDRNKYQRREEKYISRESKFQISQFCYLNLSIRRLFPLSVKSSYKLLLDFSILNDIQQIFMGSQIRTFYITLQVIHHKLYTLVQWSQRRFGCSHQCESLYKLLIILRSIFR